MGRIFPARGIRDRDRDRAEGRGGEAQPRRTQRVLSDRPSPHIGVTVVICWVVITESLPFAQPDKIGRFADRCGLLALAAIIIPLGLQIPPTQTLTVGNRTHKTLTDINIYTYIHIHIHLPRRTPLRSRSPPGPSCPSGCRAPEPRCTCSPGKTFERPRTHPYTHPTPRAE